MTANARTSPAAEEREEGKNAEKQLLESSSSSTTSSSATPNRHALETTSISMYFLQVLDAVSDIEE